MDALLSRQTWDLVSTFYGLLVVSCHWVFTKKHHPDDTVNGYKTRLVARDFTLTYGVDYLEIFSPMACLNSIRALFSLTVNHQ